MMHRLASPGDFDIVYYLYMDDYANAYLTYDPMSKEAFRPIFESVIKTQTLYVVEQNDEVIATYRLIPKTDRQQHTVYLGGFTIKDTARGKGLAAKLLAAIMEHCRDKNKIRIELTVDVDNIVAIAIYKKVGFETEGRVRKSYRLRSTNQFYDEYLMAVILDHGNR